MGVLRVREERALVTTGRVMAAVAVRTVGTMQVPTTWHSGVDWQINRQLF